MKYYQLNYEPRKLEFVCNSLILALMKLPATDFLALSYLIPTSIVNDAKISLIRKCANLLERGKYLEFWEEFVSAPDTLFSPAAGFVEAIRHFILSSLSETFKSINRATFQEQLGVNEKSIVEFCSDNKFIEKIDGDKVVFVSNEENQNLKKQTFDENWRMDEGLKLVEFLRTAKQ